MSTKLTALPEARFEQLPPPGMPGRNGTNNWTAIVGQLAQRPNEWAAIATMPNNGSAGNRGLRLRERGVITRQRSNGDGTATLYGCYVGVDQAMAAPKVERTSHRATPTPVVVHRIDLRSFEVPGPLVWAPPTEVAS